MTRASRWVLSMVVGLLGAACGSSAGEGEVATSAPPPLPAQAPSKTPPQQPLTLPALEEGLCTRVDPALAQAVFAKPISKAFGVVEDTASGKRLRCEWQGGIRSLRVSIYPDPSFWNVVVATDNVGNFPDPFPAWGGEARSNAFGFAFRLKNGGAVDLSMVGSKSKADELVALGRAFEALLQTP